jgi:hypothetical protein
LIERSDGCGFGGIQNAIEVNSYRRAVVGKGDVSIGVQRNPGSAAQGIYRRFIAEADVNLAGAGDEED